jgi:transposase-like protein
VRGVSYSHLCVGVRTQKRLCQCVTQLCSNLLEDIILGSNSRFSCGHVGEKNLARWIRRHGWTGSPRRIPKNAASVSAEASVIPHSKRPWRSCWRSGENTPPEDKGEVVTARPRDQVSCPRARSMCALLRRRVLDSYRRRRLGKLHNGVEWPVGEQRRTRCARCDEPPTTDQ